jgi:hypothetical protein
MKNTLLITASVMALVAGIGLASAQGTNERRDAPAASEQKGDSREKAPLPQKNEKMKPAPTAQAPETAKPAPTAQSQEKAKPAPTAQTQEKEKSAPTAQTQEKAKTPTAQAPEKSDSERQKVGQSPSQNTGQKASAAPMSSEQNVKFRETIKGEKAERLTNVKFSISIGEEVPTTVHFHRLPARIVEYAPQYRDFDYILVGDDILIVDPQSHRIVAVITA